MVTEIHSVRVVVIVESNKYTHKQEFEVHDLEEDLEKVKEYIEQHLQQHGW